MKTKHFNSQVIGKLLLVIGVNLILISGCQSLSSGTPTSVVTPLSTNEQTSNPVDEIIIDAPGTVSFNFSSVATDRDDETITAVLPNDNSPYWEIMPQYQVITFQGYPIMQHLLKPQIFIYPVQEFPDFNQGAVDIASNLKTLLEDQQIEKFLPFLPLYNASQALHSQVKFLDFKNGSGVRFLTQFDQAPLPINNKEIIYTFQGLSNDGKYYISAVFPVNHSELPLDDQVFIQSEVEVKNFPAYLQETADWLDQQPSDAFTPDLSILDALIQSLEVK